MTNEDALKICRLAKYAISVKHDPNNDANEVESVIEGIREQIKENADLDFMIAAIEKQIPKKIKLDKFPRVYPLCPNCGESVFYSADQYECYLTDYCPNCGQRLDWDEEEKG